MSKNNLPLILFAVLLILEQYLPTFRYNFFIQLAFLGIVLLSIKKLSFDKIFLDILKPLILIFGIGLIGMLFNKNGIVPIIKDFTYFLKPIIALIIGYGVFKSQKDSQSIFRFIVFFGAFIAFFHFFGVLIFGDLGQNSIHKIRGIFGLDNFIEVFAFYTLIFSKRFLGSSIIKNKTLFYLIASLLLGSIFLYFSRTMLIVMVLVGLSMLGYTQITKKSIKYIGAFFLLLGLMYLVLSQMKFDRNSKGFEGFLYKVKNAPQEIFNARINRDDHRQLWDRYRAYEAKRAIQYLNENYFFYITGKGHGSLVNLKFKAPLGDEEMRFISRIHNGYVFVLYKTGILGLSIYLFLLIKLFLFYRNNTVNNNHKFVCYLISSLGLFYLFSSLIITGIYIPRDMMIFLLGGFLTIKKELH